MTAKNFEQDLRTYAFDALKRHGAALPLNLPFDDLLLALFTIEERRLAPVPRRVHQSTAFAADVAGLSKPLAAAMRQILRKLRSGTDVNAHLNRRSLLPAQDDDLLVDWGLYHFHLSLQKVPGDKFLGRTGDLAFAHVTSSDAYFVRIMPHQKFAEPDLVKTLLRAFPEVAERHEVRGATGLSHPTLTDSAEVAGFRKIHVNVPIELDGKVYLGPGRGFVATGHSLTAVRRLLAIKRAIRDFEKYLQAEEASLRTQLAEKIGGDPARFVFGLTLHENQVTAFEKTTSTRITFNQGGVIPPIRRPTKRAKSSS